MVNKDYEENIPIAQEEPYDNYELMEYNNAPTSLSDKASMLTMQVTTMTNQLSMVVGQAQNLANVYSQCVEMNARTKQLEAWSQAQMVKTIAKYKTCEDFLTKSFGERNEALQKHYDVLDNAVETGDRDMIIAALQGISSIVTTSPLQDLEKFAALYDDPDQALLDF